jgi:signal transduction histidine kinase
MVVRSPEDIQLAKEQAAQLRIAVLVARDVPRPALFTAVAEEVAQVLRVEGGAVMRYIGEERAVVVGVWRDGGQRGLPVNAELDFDRAGSALGQARATRAPGRAVGYEDRRGELPVIKRSIGFRASVAAPVLRRDDVWGALVATAAEESTLPPGSELRLAGLAELVAQALANDDGRAELAASRTRLVESGDETRRRLERALHEGAQQHVVALALKLRVAHGRAVPGSEEEALLADVLADAMEASTALGELARGLQPAVLSERGLGAALQAVAARSALPVHLRELPGRRFAAVLETTVYLTVAEALANAARHAHATECRVSVADRGERLVVEVRDDGIGGATSVPGRGIECLSDRAAAIGARFTLDSPTGEGTVVRLEIRVER